MQDIDIYPGFYQLFKGKVVLLLPMLAGVLMLVPFLVDTQIILGDNFFDRALGPLVILFAYICLNAFVLDPFSKKYVKPLRFNSRGIYVPDWLAGEEFVIPRMSVASIDCFYNMHIVRRSRIELVNKIQIHTVQQGVCELQFNAATPAQVLLKPELFPFYQINYKVIEDLGGSRFISQLMTNSVLSKLCIFAMVLCLLPLISLLF